jgi:glycine zipper 2TM protein
MNRFATSMLALGLAAAMVGTASAQSSGYYPQDEYPQAEVDPYGNDGGAQYDYARVVRVDPVIVSDYRNSGGRSGGYPQQQRCYSRQDGYYAGDSGGYGDDGDRSGDYGNDPGRNDDYDRGYRGGTDAGRSVATVIGGVVGAVLGSKVGGGSARYATAAVGTMVGGIAGRQVYDSNHRYPQARNGVVTVCDPVPADGRGYSVDDSRVGAYDVTYEYAGRRYTTRTDYHPGDTIRVRVDVRPE